ncbi:MAG TPA: SDR family oxidoreductase [Chitinophagaceae bacterium]|nr:SDR family oxidoreductase [Chitinophagaceae bacterium]
MNAIITGSSKGIGYAIAARFIQDGISVALCSRNSAELNKAVESLSAINPSVKVWGLACDLRNAEDVSSFVNEAQHQLGPIHILVNNAGTYTPGDICTEAEGTLDYMLGINLYTAYHTTRALVPSMKMNPLEQGIRGHIFNMASIAALQAYPGGGSYSISKYALQGFSKNLREELKPHAIRVSTLYPGATYTDSWIGSGVSEERIMRGSDIAEMISAILRLSPQCVVEDIVLRPQLGDL